MLLYFILLIVFFAVLGKSADVVVRGVRKITSDYKTPVVFSGLILGFFTSAPEFFIGITSTIQGVSQISFGNLLGGIIVLFGLVMPLNIIINNGIKLKHSFGPSELFFSILLLLTPIFAALDGVVSFFDGIFLIILYIILAFGISEKEIRERKVIVLKYSDHNKIFFQIVVGLTGVIVSSNFIVKISLYLVGFFHLPLFLVGLTVFSIGTNLPEIIITIRSWKNKARDLALGNMVGSAVTNVLIAGIISVAKPIQVDIGPVFYSLLFFFVLLCILFMFMAKSERRFTQKEGVALAGVYLAFIITQIFIGK